MSRTDPIETIEAWLGEGPTAASDRIVADLSRRLRETPQSRDRSVLRSVWMLAPIAAAATVVAVLLMSSVLRPPVGDPPSTIPSPPATFEEGDRVDILLLIENRSERPYGSWYWSGSSAGYPTASPCRAIVVAERIRAPGVVRFGEVEPDTEVGFERESLPVLLDTAVLPGAPVGYRDDVVPVWTYAYRISVAQDGGVSLEPLGTRPLLVDAGPICPKPDTSWPGGWPMIQEWLAERPSVSDCGVERIELAWSIHISEVERNTAARRCLYEAWQVGGGAQLTTLVFTDVGPTIEIVRTSGGVVETVFQDLRESAAGNLTGAECTRLIRPSEAPGVTEPDDAALVFVVDPESCSERRVIEGGASPAP